MSRMVKSGGVAIVVVEEEEIFPLEYVFKADNIPKSSYGAE